MAGCSSEITLFGIFSDCQASKGGIVEVYMAPYDSVDVTISDDTVALQMKDSVKFKKYQFKKNTGSLTSTITKDDENGVAYYTNELSLRFPRLDNSKRTEIMSLALGELAVIVKDANVDKNGKAQYWYCTADGYMSSTAVSALTGQQATDGSRYELTLASETSELPFSIAETAVAAVVEGF